MLVFYIPDVKQNFRKNKKDVKHISSPVSSVFTLNTIEREELKLRGEELKGNGLEVFSRSKNTWYMSQAVLRLCNV
jgi:hypothetical protein